MTLTLLGYLPKRRTPVPEWLAGTAAAEICSVSPCVAEPPPDWIERWLHNGWGFCNSVEDARSLAVEDPVAYDLFAFAVHDSCYHNGLAEPLGLESPFGQPATEPLSPEPLSAQFAALGFDAVSNSGSSFFECSPLSCNLRAETTRVNRYCLLDSLEAAEEAARRFSLEQPEPGTYYVLQVLRAVR